MKIKSLHAREILDSRGMWTVEAEVKLADGASAVASVPQGKSTGSSEAAALPAEQAVRGIEKTIAPKVRGRSFADQAAFDAFLNGLDGTANKKRLGANAVLGLSIAFLRACAEAKGMPLWRHIKEVFEAGFGDTTDAKRGSRKKAHPLPRLFMNVVNGGLHAGNNLHFQEYLVIPKTSSLHEAVMLGTHVYHELGQALARSKGKAALNIGDEGGYAPDFKDDAEPFRILRHVIESLHYERSIDFGMDAAATDAKLAEPALGDFYKNFIKQFRPLYLEDPFGEEQFTDFAAITSRYGSTADAGVWIAGDDLTTTNVRRMERAHAEGSVNAVIVKPNQIGSVSEALDAVRAARRYGWRVVASHRSGETNDTFIADFAVGVGADGIKLGAPARGERIAKYNRLLEIEREIR
ncbi:MAG TPA: enolase C-terminal domain-like protein [Candidatus Paceibacterota bacterium]|nr:enolase C-terminal domain-like protein [Candidatus Paceibacterota bacterium]